MEPGGETIFSEDSEALNYSLLFFLKGVHELIAPLFGFGSFFSSECCTTTILLLF